LQEFEALMRLLVPKDSNNPKKFGRPT